MGVPATWSCTSTPQVLVADHAVLPYDVWSDWKFAQVPAGMSGLSNPGSTATLPVHRRRRAGQQAGGHRRHRDRRCAHLVPPWWVVSR
jgi:hypothetical protein